MNILKIIAALKAVLQLLDLLGPLLPQKFKDARSTLAELASNKSALFAAVQEIKATDRAVKAAKK